LSEGSNDADMAAATIGHEQSLDDISRSMFCITEITRLIERYLSGISGQAAGPIPQTAAVPSRRKATADEIETMRATLPDPVRYGSGQRTFGRWRTDSGEVATFGSGVDSDSTALAEHLTRRGMPVLPQRTTDVEMKAAMRMRSTEIRHVDLVINHIPCPAPFGCDGMVPIILPAGHTMTVHGPNFRKTYTGGAVEWWR
jgi:hypothetical protein